tara:strand:+ start:1445 stop:1969 length:525 start_codon:yes stop_codon:yes gene_type:complete
MKLVIIYGPPAVGKLTVAKELSRITGYKIFHNHITMDIISEFFEFGTKKFWEENRKLRTLLFTILSKNKINTIFTYAYTGREDNEVLKKIMEIFRKNKGKIYFVRLITSKQELEKRVKEDSRKKHGKLKDVKSLKMQFKTNDFFRKIPFEPHIEIDNTRLSAKQVASKIKKELN